MSTGAQPWIVSEVHAVASLDIFHAILHKVFISGSATHKQFQFGNYSLEMVTFLNAHVWKMPSSH